MAWDRKIPRHRSRNALRPNDKAASYAKAGDATASFPGTELVGIQMLLMKTLEPLLRGDKMAQDQLNILFRQVQTTKAAQAQELLAKRSQNREK